MSKSMRRPKTAGVSLGATAAVMLSACHAYSPLDDKPGFTPAQVRTYESAVDHLAPKYGADPSAVKAAGKSEPTSLNRAGSSWEYVVNDGRYFGGTFGDEGDQACVGINVHGVYFYERTKVTDGDDPSYACVSIERKLAEQNAAIYKLSDDGRSWLEIDSHG